MQTFNVRILLLMLLLVVFKPVLLAQEPGGTIELMPGIQDLLTIDEIPSDDENLAVETGALGEVPVDGGLSLLLAAGAAFGARRVRRGKEKN